jgi:7,8-dihydro-6-hydroxymethylpterin dimethyltransferase
MVSNNNYLYHSQTESFCPKCKKLVSSKIIIEDGSVFLLKNCKIHGLTKDFIEKDAKYYLQRYNYDKPKTSSKINMKINKGCPYDCGLCSDHEQHTCIGLIEITNDCDLKCPVCYANSGIKKNYLNLEKINEMMDFYQECENNNAEILQISGGEPTLHPKIIDIISLAKSKKFKYVMLNTNGIRIAEDLDFVKSLSKFRGGFEIYLQFDGFSDKTNRSLRGKNLNAIKSKAIENLSYYKIPITLVCTIKENVNDKEIGKIIEFAMNKNGIRGINIQPFCHIGRFENKTKSLLKRITITDILDKIEIQTDKFILKNDFVPLPCNVEKVAVTYFYKNNDSFVPITRNIKIPDYLDLIDNTFNFDAKSMQTRVMKNICGGKICNCMNFLRDVKPIIPKNFSKWTKEKQMLYIDDNTFRISVTSFLDFFNFDLKSAKKECVHIITPELKRIPFSTYNMIHRK